ncbi:hypothetical protein ABZ702_33095 [Streptomyces cyaneofuscatus]|uniref:hypothetical protein n=1 Tax=Streptomyces cyaneofuscatus TaxID=66883 RepID=UPI0033EC3F31
MNAFQHALDLAIQGLLTELPAQLVTAAMTAATVAAVRNGKKRRASAAAQNTVREVEPDPEE